MAQQAPNPSFSQITLKQAVDAMLGKDKNKPEVAYQFTNRQFVEYPNRNPYTGESS